MSSNVRARVFEHWLITAGRNEPFVYHRGELARDRTYDPSLAALADQMLAASTGRFDVVSPCGHIRGEIVGNGQVELTTRRDRGELVYLARKRLP